jgi:hypothetical protein
MSDEFCANKESYKHTRNWDRILEDALWKPGQSM